MTCGLLVKRLNVKSSATACSSLGQGHCTQPFSSTVPYNVLRILQVIKAKYITFTAYMRLSYCSRIFQALLYLITDRSGRAI
jgi:hypothetical protein